VDIGRKARTIRRMLRPDTGRSFASTWGGSKNDDQASRFGWIAGCRRIGEGQFKSRSREVT
jgi:hypothetical protein